MADAGRGVEMAVEKREFRRRLRAIERYFFRRPHANIVMAARIGGSISADQLTLALSKVRQRHLLLRVRISLDEDNIAWFTPEGVPEFSVQIVQRTTDDHWMRTVVEEHKICFPLDKGPLARFVLLRSPEVSDLIVNCHHTISDGLSLAYLIRDILVHLGDPGREVETLPVPPLVDRDHIPASASINPLQRTMIQIISKIWERKRISFSEDDYRHLHQTFWKENTSSLLAWGLTASQTAAFVSRCRREEVTVHSALCAAFLAAQSDVQGNSPAYLHTVSMPVSIRDRLTNPVGEAVGLYFSSFKIQLEYVPGQSFWSNARRIHRETRRRLTEKNIFAVQQQLDSLHPSLVDSFFFSRYGLLDDGFAAGILRMTGDDRINTGLDISNLGRVHYPEDFGPLRLEAIYGPSNYSDFQEKYLGIMTVGGKMSFTLTYGESFVEASTVEQVKDTAMKCLGEAVGW